VLKYLIKIILFVLQIHDKKKIYSVIKWGRGGGMAPWPPGVDGLVFNALSKHIVIRKNIPFYL